MQPKAISSCLIAADHGHILAQPKALLRQVYFGLECSQVSSSHTAQTWSLPKPDREAQQPFRLAQFKCHVKVRLTYSILIYMGRFYRHKLLLSHLLEA